MQEFWMQKPKREFTYDFSLEVVAWIHIHESDVTTDK